MNQHINWTESKIKEENGVKTWNLFIKPSFMDTSKTEFPDGILLHFEGQEIEAELANAEKATQKFLESMITDFHEMFLDEPEFFDCDNFKVDVQSIKKDTYHHWTMVLWDVPAYSEIPKLKAYIRFTPDFCDMEFAGFNWGLSVLDKFFDSEEDALPSRMKVERFMNQMLLDYKKIM